MTCPIGSLPEFDLEHWDVYEPCRLMNCAECAAEDGEGVFWGADEPMAYSIEPDVCDGWDIPF